MKKIKDKDDHFDEDAEQMKVPYATIKVSTLKKLIAMGTPEAAVPDAGDEDPDWLEKAYATILKEPITMEDLEEAAPDAGNEDPDWPEKAYAAMKMPTWEELIAMGDLEEAQPTKEGGERVEEAHRMLKEIYERFKPMDMKPKNKHTVILNFPEVVQWSKVLLKVKEGGMDLEIFYDGKHIKTADYVELGFSATKKNHKTDRSWALLMVFSALQKKDIKLATPNTLMGMLGRYGGRTDTISIDNVHQTKSLLSKSLKDIFKTNEDPFTDNKKYYEPKFKILPVPSMRIEKPWEQGGKLDENVDYGDLENGEE